MISTRRSNKEEAYYKNNLSKLKNDINFEQNSEFINGDASF
jgi:hypothetical protein